MRKACVCSIVELEMRNGIVDTLLLATVSRAPLVKKLKHLPIIWLLFSGLAWTSPALAERDGVPWCLPKDAVAGKDWFGPDGAVTQVGEVFFRVCQSGNSRPPSRRVISIRVNPDRIPDLVLDRSIIALMVNTFPFQKMLARTQDMYTHIGERRIGGEIYKEYRFFSTIHNRWSDGRHFVFDPVKDNSQSSTPPRHIVSCNSDLRDIIAKSSTCRIFVGYRGLSAHLLFIGGGPDFLPNSLPVESFPVHASDIIKILNAVTVDFDDVDAIKGLPFIE